MLDDAGVGERAGRRLPAVRPGPRRVAALMVPEYEYGKFAGWIAAAARGHQRPAGRVRLRAPRRGRSRVNADLAARRASPSGTPTSARVIGGAPEGAFVIPFHEGDALPGEWFVARDGDRVVGYGRLDIGWGGDAEILLAVDPERQEAGVGSFVLARLEDEAAARGINYVYNTIRQHEGRELVHDWLVVRGFRGDLDGDLRKRVGSSPAHSRPDPAAGSGDVRRRGRRGRAGAGSRGAGRVRRRRRAPVLSPRRFRDRTSSFLNQRRRSGERTGGLGERPPGGLGGAVPAGVLVVERAGGARPGPVVVEQLGRQVRVEERETPPLLDHLHLRDERLAVARRDRGSRSRRGSRGSGPRRPRGPRPRPADGPRSPSRARRPDPGERAVGQAEVRTTPCTSSALLASGRPTARTSAMPRPSQISRVRSRCRSWRWVSGIGTLSTSQRPSHGRRSRMKP